MIVHHDKPVGVDSFYREIFPGDTVRDIDGQEYTIDERGYAKSLDGVTVTGFKRLIDPVFVKGSEKTEIPAKFQEDASGKVVPVDVPKPEPRVRLAPIAKEYGFSTYEPNKKVEAAGISTFGKGGLIYIQEKDIHAAREALKPGSEPVAQKSNPDPAPTFIEGPAPHKGGRVNKSGYSQVGNLCRRFGMNTSEAVKLFKDNGITVEARGPQHKAHIRSADLPVCRQLLEKACGVEDPGNHGNHRPNSSGYVTFANLARSLKGKAHVLRAFAAEKDIPIVRPADKAHRNDGIYKEDEERYRELWAADHGAAAPDHSDIKVSGKQDLLTIPLKDEDVMKEVELRNLWDRVLERYPGFIEAISKPVKVEETSDQYLADELRRRGYDVTAIKHVEL